MSASRPPFLSFLYPVLFKPRSCDARGHRNANANICARPRLRVAPLHSSAARSRYGTANKPPAHLSDKDNELSVTSVEKQASKGTSENENGTKEASGSSTSGDAASQPSTQLPTEESQTKVPPTLSVSESPPMETVLHMPSPADSAKKPPHLQTPPYVHHFDTYGLVKHLEGSGFSQEQSVTVMKAIRGLLTQNMETAREALVSKSNVENEGYLFRAACSELRTEIQNNRNGETEKMRQERTQLQHEVDILNQRFSQERETLKDELKGLFDDRKMAVRAEQKSMENTIQELNYKITVSLNSDARSEVESLRWLLTRRAATALAISAVMILATLRYSTYMTQTQEQERKEMAKRNAQLRLVEGDGEGTQMRDVPAPVTKEANGDNVIVAESGGKGYVSLG
ncbi:hypothetical protein EJ05DRAFT_451672 [Pseudovirgaria hyperparasitica]|uniref:DUF1640-domain-containing protein n=1 Tax=Pseudovirgaria hyperparasitica TaxID=470096 RepID=A0A6A6W9Q2_9PEZI|nr:uncharacterized protein EJ05DRAFT_451672 [Pseudovirgaria hyperparasitica]KAF2759403.1 hypothetical protein EJ05DRAFT_451672 [Pseudovirgaria hyperparasitica]